MSLSKTYTKAERIADGVIHWIGLTAGPVGVVALFILASWQESALLTVSIALYALGLLAMLSCSALYQMASQSPHRELFRRLDHAAIFLMIAGSYTPFALVSMGGAWGWSLFGVAWGVAIGGIALKLLHPRRFEKLAIALYLALGWLVVVALDPFLSAVSLAGAILIGVGGVLYTVGVAFHLWRRLPFQNAIWHAFVLAAVGCHYAAVVVDVALRGGPVVA